MTTAAPQSHTSNATITVRSPSDRRVLDTLTPHTPADVAYVVNGLRSAQVRWEDSGVAERVKWLRRYRDWLLDNDARLARLVHEETGKPAAEAPLEVALPIDVLNYYADRAADFLGIEHPWPHGLLTAPKRLEVAYRPYPVAGVISPWNFPLALSLFDAIPALLAGAAVVVKPSEYTPLAVRAAVEGGRRSAHHRCSPASPGTPTWVRPSSTQSTTCSSPAPPAPARPSPSARPRD